MKLTDNEIIKALECCNKPIGQAECSKCSYFETENSCAEKLINDTVGIINRQKAEIERLWEVINGFEEQSHKELLKFVDLSEKYTNAKAEIERLYIEGLQINKTFMDFVNKQIAEAVKEFAERLIHEIVNRPSEIQSISVEYLHGSAYRQNEIVDLVKEMVGDNNV